MAAQLNPIGGDAFWGLYIGQDEKNSEKIAAMLWQSGLGLPERDYYFNKEEGVAKNRAAYPVHIARMLVLLGQDSTSAMKAGAEVNTLKNYLRFHLASTYAPYLSSAIGRENFAFYGTELNGRKEQRPRWKRALDAEENAIGMILGKVYARDYFNERTKKRYNDLVEAIRTTYGEHIQALDWMSAPTKAKAMEKLTTMTKKVGYPDKWKDMSDLAMGIESFAANMRNAMRWQFNDDV